MKNLTVALLLCLALISSAALAQVTVTKTRDLTAAQFKDNPTRYPGQICELRVIDPTIANDTGALWHGWDQGGGKFVRGVMVQASPEAQAITAAQDSAASTVATKRAQAITAVRAEVTRIKAIAAGSRTSTEKAFLGLAYLAFSEE